MAGCIPLVTLMRMFWSHIDSKKYTYEIITKGCHTEIGK